VCELIGDALHHMSAGAAYLHRHAVSLECLGQPGQEGALVVLLLSCGLPVWYIRCDHLKCTLTSAATAGVTVAAVGTEGPGGPPGALRAEP
jgi:hypothetical protein